MYFNWFSIQDFYRCEYKVWILNTSERCFIAIIASKVPNNLKIVTNMLHVLFENYIIKHFWQSGFARICKIIKILEIHDDPHITPFLTIAFFWKDCSQLKRGNLSYLLSTIKSVFQLTFLKIFFVDNSNFKWPKI